MFFFSHGSFTTKVIENLEKSGNFDSANLLFNINPYILKLRQVGKIFKIFVDKKPFGRSIGNLLVEQLFKTLVLS